MSARTAAWTYVVGWWAGMVAGAAVVGASVGEVWAWGLAAILAVLVTVVAAVAGVVVWAIVEPPAARRP